jgi:O-antigen ligase
MTSTDHPSAEMALRPVALAALGGVVATPFFPGGMMFASCCMMAIGLWAWLAGRWHGQPADKPAGVVNAAFALYALGSAAISFSRGDSLSQFEQYLPFLGAGLLGIGFRVARLPLATVGSAFAAGAILAALACAAQVVLSPETKRAELSMFSTWLGTLGALYAVLCAGLAIWVHDGARHRYLMIAGAASGAIVALLSGSKGSWLVLLAATPVVLTAVVRQAGWRRSILPVSLIGGCLAAGFLLPNSPVAARLAEAAREGDRLRSAYWQEAASLFAEQPLLGAGRGRLRANLEQASLRVREGVPLGEAPNDAHNEYLDILAVRGAAGLLLVLLALAVPFAMFRVVRRDPRGRAAANTGLLFVFAFAVAGLTDVQFAVNMKRMLYLFTVLFLLVSATAGEDPAT